MEYTALSQLFAIPNPAMPFHEQFNKELNGHVGLKMLDKETFFTSFFTFFSFVMSISDLKNTIGLTNLHFVFLGEILNINEKVRKITMFKDLLSIYLIISIHCAEFQKIFLLLFY